jgi:hypothetical protein
MENIIRGTTPSLILDFADRTEFTNSGTGTFAKGADI